MGHLLDPVQLADVIQRVEGGREPAVLAQDLVLDARRQGEVVKRVCELLPNLWATVSSNALVEEAVDLRDLATLVVPAEQGDTVFVTHLVQEHERDRLHRVPAAVNVVAHKE